MRGRIDRVDEHDGMALVIDYKTGKRVDRYKVASWEPENRFQAALYMLVVERLLGLRAAGGVYVALGSDDPRPRGMVAADVDELGAALVLERPARRRTSSARSSTGRSSGSARPTR